MVTAYRDWGKLDRQKASARLMFEIEMLYQQSKNPSFA